MVDARDRTASGANLDHLDHGHPQRQAAAFLEAVDACHFELGGAQRPAIIDQTGLGGGASHVEAEQVALARRSADRNDRLHAAGWAGLHESHGISGSRRFVDGAAIRQHQVEILGDAMTA